MPRPTFAPTPLSDTVETSASIKESSFKSSLHQATAYQPTLFELRFGPRRNRQPRLNDSGPFEATTSSTTSESPKKRTKIERYGDDTDLSPHAEAALAVAAPLNGHRGPFHPITRKQFCDAYRVEGLPGADIYYKSGWIDARTAERWRKELTALSDWYQPKLKVYGKEITQCREICAYATEPGLDLKYRYACLGSEVRFNHCVLNRYDDGKIYIGKHSDNKENKVIVTVSLRADRSWIMKRKATRKRKSNMTPLNDGEKGGGDEKEVKVKRWILRNGSLLVMQGETQQLYTHKIPKELKVKRPRISITFRQLSYE